MLRVHREILNEFKKLKGKASVIAYGSVVKGSYRLDSDIDIAVITKSNQARKLAEKIADKILLKYGKVVSLKFLTKEDLKKQSTFVKEVLSGRRIV